MGATTRTGQVSAAKRSGWGSRSRLRGWSAGSALVVGAVLAASLGGPGAGLRPGSGAVPVPVPTAPVSQVSAVPVSHVVALPAGSSSNGGCQFNNNTINSGPGFDRRDLPFFSGRGFHRHGVPFLGEVIGDLMRRCLDQMDDRGGGFSHLGSHSDD